MVSWLATSGLLSPELAALSRVLMVLVLLTKAWRVPPSPTRVRTPHSWAQLPNNLGLSAAHIQSDRQLGFSLRRGGRDWRRDPWAQDPRVQL